jgi:hypothetical protein
MRFPVPPVLPPVPLRPGRRSPRPRPVPPRHPLRPPPFRATLPRSRAQHRAGGALRPRRERRRATRPSSAMPSTSSGGTAMASSGGDRAATRHALFAQHPLNAAHGHAPVVQQHLDPAHQLHVRRPVIAAATGALSPGLIWVNFDSQKRSTWAATPSQSATSRIVRNASGDLLIRLQGLTTRIAGQLMGPDRTHRSGPVSGRHAILHQVRGPEGQDAPRADRHFFPGLGVAPMRAVFERTENVPKDDSFTCSPSTRASDIISNPFHKLRAFVPAQPDFANTASERSIRVRVLPAIGSRPPLVVVGAGCGKRFLKSMQGFAGHSFSGG